jgi:hypothetical protein
MAGPAAIIPAGPADLKPGDRKKEMKKQPYVIEAEQSTAVEGRTRKLA